MLSAVDDTHEWVPTTGCSVRHREVKELAQDHTASQQEAEPGSEPASPRGCQSWRREHGPILPSALGSQDVTPQDVPRVLPAAPPCDLSEE